MKNMAFSASASDSVFQKSRHGPLETCLYVTYCFICSENNVNVSQLHHQISPSRDRSAWRQSLILVLIPLLSLKTLSLSTSLTRKIRANLSTMTATVTSVVEQTANCQNLLNKSGCFQVEVNDLTKRAYIVFVFSLLLILLSIYI